APEEKQHERQKANDHFPSPAISFLSVARARRIDARDVSFWLSEAEMKATSQRAARAFRAVTTKPDPPDPRTLNSYPDSTGYSGIFLFGPHPDLPSQNNVKFYRPQ